MNDEHEALALSQENGRSATANAHGNNVVITFWRKNKSPLLPLILTRRESRQLRAMLEKAEQA